MQKLKVSVFLGSRQVSTLKINELVCDLQRESEGDRDTAPDCTLSSRTHHPLGQVESTG